jgi:cyclohexyl-isocyanide hydratase
MSIDAGVTHRIIGTEAEVTDDSGLTLSTDAVYEDLAPFDLLYIPGGFGTRALVNDARLLDYLRTWGPERPLASVCTGSLLLGHAGYLKDRRATTHHHAYDLLRPLCREVVTDRRIVDEGPVITAGGVSSALDLGLYLVERFWGEDARTRIATQMEYRAYAPR